MSDFWLGQRHVSWRRRRTENLAVVVVVMLFITVLASTTVLTNGGIVVVEAATAGFIVIPFYSKTLTTRIKKIPPIDGTSITTTRNGRQTRTTRNFFPPSSSPPPSSFYNNHRVVVRRRNEPPPSSKSSSSLILPPFHLYSSPKDFFFSVIRRRRKRRRKGSSEEETVTTKSQKLNGDNIEQEDDDETIQETGVSTFPSSSPASMSNETLSNNNLVSEYDSNIIELEFTNDLTKVLKVLMPDDYDDPEVPAFLKQRRLSLTNSWTLDDWARHSTRWRFLHYMQSLPTSRLLNRVAPQLSALMGWTLLAIIISPRGLLSQAIIPLTPLALVSTFVGALLTMRSNTGLARLAEGRMAWGTVVLQTREISQLLSTKVYPHNSQLCILLARHLAIYGWVLKAHLRGTQHNVEEIVRTMLPSIDAEYILSQRKLPAAILTKLRQGIHQLTSSSSSTSGSTTNGNSTTTTTRAKKVLTTGEEIAFERSIEQLDHALMTTERIRASPIPPLYTSHTSRLLMFYLWFLPLALHQSSLNGFVTFLVSLVVGYTMLGLDEISHLLEQPFRLMPLLQLSKMSMLDVGDSILRRPPSIEDSLSSQLSSSVVSSSKMIGNNGEDEVGLHGTEDIQEGQKTPEYW